MRGFFYWGIIMKTTIFICLFVFFLLIPAQSFGQDGLSIDNIYLKLGTSKMVVMDKFKDYQVSNIPVASYDSYVISKKDEVNDLNIFYGTVGFKKNQLAYISRRWFLDYQDIKINEFVDKLFHLISKDGKEQMDINVRIKTSTYRAPDHEI
jgi:hypothetical protein